MPYMDTDKLLNTIANAIKDTEFEGNTYIAGGYVRDRVMNLKSDDIDLVVARPDGGIRLAEHLHAKKLSSKPVIYKRYGTAMIMMSHHKVEIVMTRGEKYTKGSRNPEVFYASIKDDVFRRDFTINSLVMDVITHEIFDYTGCGKKDIECKIIKTPLDPDKIFSDDPLRMLRAIRFAVRYDFEIEENAYKWIKTHSKLIDIISAERKRDELLKILSSNHPAKGVLMLMKTGLMYGLIPELYNLAGLAQNKFHNQDAMGHTLTTLKLVPPEPRLRMAALLHDIAKYKTKKKGRRGVHFFGHDVKGAGLAKSILSRLKFAVKDNKYICFLVKNHLRLKNAGIFGERISNKKLRALIFEAGHRLEGLLDLIHADNMAHHSDYRRDKQVDNIRKRIKLIWKKDSPENLPITGMDIINFFKISPGKRVGSYLELAKEIWLENPEITAESLLNKLKKLQDKI